MACSGQGFQRVRSTIQLVTEFMIIAMTRHFQTRHLYIYTTMCEAHRVYICGTVLGIRMQEVGAMLGD
jgi:hypothetical protein